jgi:hypothetical protein
MTPLLMNAEQASGGDALGAGWLGGGGLRLDSGLGAGNLWGVWCSLGEGDSVWCSTCGGVVLGWCWLSCRPGG